MYREDILSKQASKQVLGDLRFIALFFAVRSAIRLLLHYKAVIFAGQEPCVPAEMAAFCVNEKCEAF